MLLPSLCFLPCKYYFKSYAVNSVAMSAKSLCADYLQVAPWDSKMFETEDGIKSIKNLEINQ